MMADAAHNKRGFSHTAGEETQVTAKRAKTPAREENDDEDLLSLLTMDDEAVTDLSKLLEPECVSSPPFKVKFACDPFCSPEIFMSSAAYITINGNNDESCGSSFSESESSVMASVDLGLCGFKFGRRGVAEYGGAWREREEARGWVADNGECGLNDKKMDGCDFVFDFDDDMLARFLAEDLVDPSLGF